MIDTHCHLNFKSYKKDYKAVYERAIQAGVEKMVIVGASLHSSQLGVELVQELPHCYASIGVHPHHQKELKQLGEKELKKQLRELIQSKKIVAIGETGFDYYTYKNYPPVTEEEKEEQEKLFTIHLELAKEFDLPIIFHCREAMEDMLNYLVRLFEQSNQPRGVFHCFGGNKDDLKKVLDLGFYVGFDGNITYESNEELRQLVAETPLDRLLLETDAPFLTPVPHRGTRNEPMYITLVAKEVARIKGMTIKDVETQTSRNALDLFMPA